MPARHVVVDGSNIATEGSSLPSLKQLDQAVREFLAENPDDVVTVVVDATFGHRIPAEEREMFEQAELDADVVSPPAGAIGRGDAFLLRVADKIGASVLSNDSFQEFHGEYEWLFDRGRLIGGKPVPGVGWIFTPRSPVRGPKSREAVKEAKRRRRQDEKQTGEESGLVAAERTRHRPGGERRVQRAIAAAVEEAVTPEEPAGKRRRRRRGREAPSEPLNEPYSFITFIAAHPLGAEVVGTVDEFSSHGAFISVEGTRCYIPLSAMGDPPPRAARDALRKGEPETFVVQALDAMRRGIELALPGFAHIAGAPTEETIEAEIHRPGAGGEEGGADEAPAARRRAPRSRAAAAIAGAVLDGHEVAPPARPTRRRPGAVAVASVDHEGPVPSVPGEDVRVGTPSRATGRSIRAAKVAEDVTAPALAAAGRTPKSRAASGQGAAGALPAKAGGTRTAKAAKTVEPPAKATRAPTRVIVAGEVPVKAAKAAKATGKAAEVAAKATRAAKVSKVAAAGGAEATKVASRIVKASKTPEAAVPPPVTGRARKAAGEVMAPEVPVRGTRGALPAKAPAATKAKVATGRTAGQAAPAKVVAKQAPAATRGAGAGAGKAVTPAKAAGPPRKAPTATPGKTPTAAKAATVPAAKAPAATKKAAVARTAAVGAARSASPAGLATPRPRAATKAAEAPAQPSGASRRASGNGAALEAQAVVPGAKAAAKKATPGEQAGVAKAGGRRASVRLPSVAATAEPAVATRSVAAKSAAATKSAAGKPVVATRSGTAKSAVATKSAAATAVKRPASGRAAARK